jgi:hypothetical protein
MGIDIYAACRGQPDATRILVPEAFDRVGQPVAIPAALLRARLPATLATVDMRERKTDVVGLNRELKSYCRFVELCEKIEAQSGEPCRIVARY